MNLTASDFSIPDLSKWQGVPRPSHAVLEGRYARLEPLDSARHGDQLFEMTTGPGQEDLFRYLFDEPPQSRADYDAWLESSAASSDPLFFALIDKNTERAEGRQGLMRIDAANGCVEMGQVQWGPAIARSRVTTEAVYLFANHVFALGYRRFEWKCNALNEPSRRAALRFGFQFEGIFRQHFVTKGRNRDTAWFSMIDSEWPRLRAGYEKWLRPDNFDAQGQQKSKLEF
jgi:RimJ/RimL family protein N-acetyltransferase